MARELEWIRQNAKGKPKKGKAREGAYEDLVRRASEYQKAEKLDSMFCPQGSRLGNVAVEAQDVQKGFGGRLYYEGLSFSLPPGGTTFYNLSQMRKMITKLTSLLALISLNCTIFS